ALRSSFHLSASQTRLHRKPQINYALACGYASELAIPDPTWAHLDTTPQEWMDRESSCSESLLSRRHRTVPIPLRIRGGRLSQPVCVRTWFFSFQTRSR